ncbi:MAG: hypothetical protein LBQ50_07730 [Planctomycetaceae bacterium]|jgi:hypothetical protein|nr:hypothetical protein [Planctomycetaceae bacterium]
MQTNVGEMTWKHQVAKNFFNQYDVHLDEEFIDFVVAPQTKNKWLHNATLIKPTALLWAEAKKNVTPTAKMFAQLILTIKPVLEGKDAELPPKFLAAFDNKHITFVEFYHAQPLLAHPDINWNETPSSVSKKTENIVTEILADKWIQYNIITDRKEIKNFIALNFIDDGNPYAKTQVTKNNFLSVFTKWANEVQPSINYNWKDGKKSGILPADFYLADLLSRNNRTIFDSLKVVLRDTEYKITVEIKEQLFKEVHFKDDGKAHRQFWKRYQRPPENEYQEYIKARRDLLVPQNIREYTGAYFTPPLWVETSQNYLTQTFGNNWQDEYYLWDCAAGTGNLLEGLTNPYHIWASTLMQADVDIMKDRIVKHGFNLLESHVFQFDFLNDDFTDLPKGLQNIINNPEKRKKLIIYINPPYAEATNVKTTSKSGENRNGIASDYNINTELKPFIGKATNEFYALFMARIYRDIPDCHLAQFSTLKFVSSQNFKQFRRFFKAKFDGGFIVCANTFDNVNGLFPIGFTIWDTAIKKTMTQIKVDILENDKKVENARKIGTKKFFAIQGDSINVWIKKFDKAMSHVIGFMCNPAPDFLPTNQPYITNEQGTRHFNYYSICSENLLQGSIYFAVRLCIEHTWVNHRDQFLYPNDGWETDEEFQRDCLIFTLFHHKNRISSRNEINHWLPFRASEVNAKDNFTSEFMADILNQHHSSLSASAVTVYNAGKALWQYYHEQKNRSLNASLYEIREYFKGRNENGRMNTKSGDTKFNELDKALRDSLAILAETIKPKVFEYGFLME